MRKLLLIVVFFLCGADLYAAEKTLTWSNPTNYEDGSVLALDELVDYDIACTSVNDQNYQVVDSFAAPATSRVVTLQPGSHWCVIRVSTANATSDWSTEVFFTLPFPNPNPPANLAAD